MATVGLLTFCDGRDFVVANIGDFSRRVEDEIAARAGRCQEFPPRGHSLTNDGGRCTGNVPLFA
jgi:hypothetical protein